MTWFNLKEVKHYLLLTSQDPIVSPFVGDISSGQNIVKHQVNPFYPMLFSDIPIIIELPCMFSPFPRSPILSYSIFIYIYIYIY